MKYLFIFLATAGLSLSASAWSLPNFLGNYVVSNILENDSFYNGSVCQPYVDSTGEKRDADFRCAEKLLVFRNPAKDQIAMFSEDVSTGEASNREGSNGETLFTFSVFRAALFSQNRKCQTSIGETELTTLFSSQVCRGFLTAPETSSLKTKTSDFYFYFPNMEPKAGQADTSADEALARAIVTGAMTGIPIGMASAYLIEVPRGQSEPTILIHELTTGVAFGARANFRSVLTLTPIL